MIDSDNPFDIRACPIWAIPAIGRVLRTPGVEILSFRVEQEDEPRYEMEPGTPNLAGKCGVLTVLLTRTNADPGVPAQQVGKIYKGMVYKNLMNTDYYPRFFGWSEQ